uniref:Uncharacterized protein n=1 Tax=Lygus hesperus TaxID=30085 RepID=A0A146LIX7_LYGHE
MLGRRLVQVGRKQLQNSQRRCFSDHVDISKLHQQTIFRQPNKYVFYGLLIPSFLALQYYFWEYALRPMPLSEERQQYELDIIQGKRRRNHVLKDKAIWNFDKDMYEPIEPQT